MATSASLERVPKSLPPEGALNLFMRKVDLASWVDEVTSRDTPLYTLGELERLTESFLLHLEQNRQHVVKSGHQRINFERSRWLHNHLTKLYYVKQPEVVSWIRNREGNFVCHYVWVMETDGLDSATIEGMSKADDEEDFRAYEKADYLEILRPEDAVRLERARSKLFELKIAITKQLLQAVRLRTASDLWKNCLQLLKDGITASEADFYLGIDRSYVGFDIRTGQEMDEGDDPLAGGLTDLLYVIGHYEKELTIGEMVQTRDALGELVQSDWLGRPKPVRPDDFQLMTGQQQEVLEKALDRFLSLQTEVQVFWTEYIRRVNQALEHEFYEEVSIQKRVRRDLVHKFEPVVQSYASWLKNHLEVTSEDQIAAPWKVLSQEEVVAVRQKKRGRKPLGKINRRRKIVRKFIKRKRDFNDLTIFHNLVSELDLETIPPLVFADRTTFRHPWVEVQDDENLRERVIKALNEDRWD